MDMDEARRKVEDWRIEYNEVRPLARQIECPIYGVRAIRLPGHRFCIESTDEIAPVRNAMGRVDVDRTMQAITCIVEGWIREHPEQWLWAHRRWR